MSFKKTVGDKYPRDVAIPFLDFNFKTLFGARMFRWRTPNKGIHAIWGMGTLLAVSKGNEFDFIRVNFGFLREPKVYNIIVKEINARKQLSMCKINQYIEVIGMQVLTYLTKTQETVDEEGKWAKHIYAQALRPYYVPTMVDIRNNSDDEFESIKEQEFTDGNDFLSQFE